MKTTNLFGRLQAAILMIALGTSALISCSVEKEYSIGDPDEDGIEMTISIGQPGTRTDNSGDSTLWTEGDALSVFHSAAGQSTFWSSWFGFYYGNMFQGTVKKLSATNDWYAVYPYRETNTSPGQLHLSFASQQTQKGNSNKGHFAGELFPMYGKTTDVSRTDDLSISMSNVLSAVELKVTNNSTEAIVVEEVDFTAESYIAGDFSVDLTGEAPVITSESRPTKKVSLTVEDGEAIAVGDKASFYLAIAPYEVPAGGEIKVKVVAVHPDDTRVVYNHTFTLENATEFVSGKIKVVNVAFDENSSENPDTCAASEVELEVGEQPEDGEYLLVYENGDNSMAFAAFADQKANNYAIPVSVVDGVAVPKDGQDLSKYAITIEVAKDESGNPIEHGNDTGHYAYNVRNTDGQYVFYSTGGGTLDASDALQIKDINEMDIDGTVYKYYHTFVQAADGIQVLSSIFGASGGNKYLLAYSAANGFYYEEDNSGQKLHLYLLGGSAKEKQNPYFDLENVTYDFDALGEGTLPNQPTLKNARTTVTYSSGNTSVATVDEHTGAVTIHNPGTAVITATAAADETYYAATAKYTIEVTSSTVQTWYKAEAMVAGTQYLVISNGYALQNNNGSVAAMAVSVTNETITLNAPSGILWTANSSNQLTNNSQYLGTSSSSSGGWPGGGYGGSSSLAIGSQSNAKAWTYEADSNYLTFSENSTWGGTTTNYLYYSTSSNAFTINSSASDTHIASLYSTVKPLEKQNLSFDKAVVSKVLGEDCEVEDTFDVQQVHGAHTTVTYTSSNSNVAIITGTRITVKGLGYTTITATAVADDEYKSGSATYTLRINNPAPEGFTSLGLFNLENSTVSDYLTAANSQYTDDNYTSLSIISKYTNNGRPKTRLDVPEPVKLVWDNASTGTATIIVYNDQALTDEVWTWTAASGSTSFDVYNLIPGRTYYCTVVDSNGDYLLKATFETTGRRRMLKVSDTESANHANNCRDLGGLKTTSGKRIKYGMIFRGTNLTSTTADEKKYLVEFMNIGLDNDLRDGSGGSSNRDEPFANTSYDVDYCGPGYGTGIGSTTGSSLTNPDRAKLTMQAFIDCAKRGKASYFHCYIGSDRTGYWGFFLECLLGVSPKDASMDFELTGFAGNITSGDRPRNSTGYTYYQGMNYFKEKSYYNGNMEDTISQYVTSELGISASDLQAFRNAVLEDDPDQ